MEKISRTKQKKAAQALQKLGEQLVDFSDRQFALLKLPESLMEAVSMARQIQQHEARRRQLQYIGRLMRSYDPIFIQDVIENVRSEEVQEKRHFKLVERWRDELVEGDHERFLWLIKKFPDIDQDELNRLIHNARGNRSNQTSSKKAGKLLFRFLHAL